MLKKKQLLILFIIGIILLFTTACPEINTSEKKEKKKPPLELNVTGTVHGLEAFSLQYDNHIELRWYEVEGCDGYNIYRYAEKNEEALEATFFSEIEFYEDDAANPDQVYYYRVSFVKEDRESVKNPNFIAAVYSSTIDSLEPNNESPGAVLSAGITYDALIYSFNKGDFQDRDFYTLPDTQDRYSLQIVFDENSPLLSNLQLLYGNSVMHLNATNNLIDFSDSITSFRIEFKSASVGFDGVGKYQLILSER